MAKRSRTQHPTPAASEPSPIAPRKNLKAERIQAAGGPPPAPAPRRTAPAPRPEPLPAAEVAKLLAGLPGWRAKGGNRALVRHFGFPGDRTAQAFAQFVLEWAAAGGFNAWVELRQNVAVVTLFTPRVGGVSLADLQLAEMLVEPRA